MLNKEAQFNHYIKFQFKCLLNFLACQTKVIESVYKLCAEAAQSESAFYEQSIQYVLSSNYTSILFEKYERLSPVMLCKL